MSKKETIEGICKFFEEEKKIHKKGSQYMRKLYLNRVNKNREKDLEIIWFIFNYIWYMYFDENASTENINKLTYGFEMLGWEDALWTDLGNYLEFRKTELWIIKEF